MSEALWTAETKNTLECLADYDWARRFTEDEKLAMRAALHRIDALESALRALCVEAEDLLRSIQ